MVYVPAMGAGFKRSRLLALIGIPLVAILAAAIGLAADGGEYPKGAIALILAIIFGFVALLLVVQRRDLDGVAAADERAAIAPPGRSPTPPRSSREPSSPRSPCGRWTATRSPRAAAPGISPASR